MKRYVVSHAKIATIVAPRRGAWVETVTDNHVMLVEERRTPQGCVG